MRKETIEAIRDVIYMDYVNVINDLGDKELLKKWKTEGIDVEYIYKEFLRETENGWCGFSTATRFDGKENIIKEIKKQSQLILKAEF